MITVILVIHLVIATVLVGLILIQRSEGGGLGLGGGGGNMGGFMTARGTANLLTRSTAILAGCFIVTSLALAILSGNTGTRSLFDSLPAAPAAAPAGTGQPAPEAAPAPAQPAAPSAPLAQ